MADITISREVAEQLYDLYHNVELADTHYKRCQSDNFRLHVCDVYKNANVAGAFATLKSQLDKPAEPSKGRRSVLTSD